MKAQLYKANSETAENVTLDSFAAIKKAIGGGHVCIAEIHPPTKDGFDMLCCDEDGMAKEQPRNKAATIASGWPYPLLGVVVFCKHDDFMAL